MADTPSLHNWSELTDEENKLKKSLVTQWPFDDMIRFPENVILPRPFLNIASRIYNFPVREDDIWLVTYPKCGTTWGQEMLWQLVNDVDKKRGKMPLFTRTPFLEMGCLMPKEKPVEGVPNQPSEALEMLGRHMADPIEYTQTLEGRRVIKCHLPIEFPPPAILEKCKIVYICRNPKDCAVSYYHHEKMYMGYEGNFQQYIDLFERGLVMYGSYWHHLQGGWRIKDRSNVKFIWFEEMKGDPGAL